MSRVEIRAGDRSVTIDHTGSLAALTRAAERLWTLVDQADVDAELVDEPEPVPGPAGSIGFAAALELAPPPAHGDYAATTAHTRPE